MSLVRRLLAALADRGFRASQAVVCSLRPDHKDKRVYCCYEGAELRYIATSFRADSPAASAFREVDDTVASFRQRIADDPISSGILHASCSFELDGHMFCVSRYVRPALVFRAERFNFRNFGRLLAESSDWILRFQERTTVEPTAVDIGAMFRDRLAAWSTAHRDLLPEGFDALLEGFLPAWHTTAGKLPVAGRHGDYCFCNYFCDRRNRFYVFDWEFAAQRDCVACDFFSNLVVYAGRLRAASRLGAYTDLFDRANPRNRCIRALQESMRTFEEAYGATAPESRVLFVYAYLYLMMRCRTRPMIAERLRAVPELTECVAR